MNRKEIKHTANVVSKENRGILLLASVLSTIACVIPVLGFIVTGPVLLGHQQLYYDAYKGQPLDLKTLYSKFKKQFDSSFYYCVLMLAVCVVTCEALVLVFLLATRLLFSVTVLGILLYIVTIAVAIVISLILSGAFVVGLQLFVNEPELKGNEVFRISMEILKANWTEILVFQLSFIGEALLTIVTFGVYGIKFVTKYNLAMVIYSEKLITANQKGEAAGDGKFCPRCGAANETDAVFCVKCGNKF